MLHVAYDVSAAAPSAGSAQPVTGVGRVIREVLIQLVRAKELHMSAVGCFAGDWNPLATSLRAEQWAGQAVPGGLPAASAFRSRTGLVRVLGRVQLTWEDSFERRHGSKAEALLLRGFRRVLRGVARPGFPERDVDLFHATFRPPPTFLNPEIPRVYFLYDIIPARLPQECGPVPCAMLTELLASLDPRRDVVVAISEFTKRDFCQLTEFPPARVVVAPLAADATFHPVLAVDDLSRVRVRYGIGDQPYCLSVANPQPRKNLARIIRSFYRAARAMPDWSGTLVLAGDERVGWGGQEIEQVIQEEPNLAARVQSIGRVAERDLAALYSGCLCFVFPSIYEGFGLPVLEAMQCGAPVVTSNTASLPEVAGEAALLVDPLDEEDIARALTKLIGDSALRSKLSAAGIERAGQFSWSRTAAQVTAAYRLACRVPSPCAS